MKINNTVSRLEALSRVEAFRKLGKQRRLAEARKVEPQPRLTAEQRADRYREQNGTRTLTAKQKARIAKKEGRLGGHAPVSKAGTR